MYLYKIKVKILMIKLNVRWGMRENKLGNLGRSNLNR